MQRALDAEGIKTEELMWHPFERCAGMRATIDISKVLSLFIDDKYFMLCACIYDGKPARGIRCYFVNMAELDMMLFNHEKAGQLM